MERLSSVDELLRAVSRAPVPETLPLPRLALPGALLDTLAQELPVLPAPRVGEHVDGRYRIDDKLGIGGMGIVYAATQLSTGRKVALKWMQVSGSYRTASERDDAFQRFVREARATGRIQHPNVVDVYDAGRDPRAPFLVMQHLHGKTLRAHMQERGPLGWDEALALLLPAMAGVTEAHRCGVVHRDLKPDNVFLAQEQEGLVPKVLDFGVSRLRQNQEGPGEEPSLTRTGTVLGTPAYMPLEQLRAVGEVDERTDVYALAVMLYEMLAGKRPYEARNAADFAALLASEPPVPLVRYRPDLRGAREAAVMRALARQPAERPASVEAFAARLRGAQHTSARRSLAAAGSLIVALALTVAYLTLLRAPASAPARKHRPDAAPRAESTQALPSSHVVDAQRGPPAPPAESATHDPPEPLPLTTRPARPPAARQRETQAVRPPPHPGRAGTTAPRAQRPLTSLDEADFVSSSGQPRAEPAKTAPAPEPSLTLGRDQF